MTQKGCGQLAQARSGGEASVIKDRAYWEAWEARVILSQPADFHRNLALVESMYELARKVGAFPLGDPLEGIETKIRVARVVNVPTNSGTNGLGA